MREVEILQLCTIKNSLLEFSQEEKERFIKMLKKEFDEKAQHIITILNLQ